MIELKEPLNERGTIFFFNAIQEYMQWRLAYCGNPFPDAIISNGYETLLAEFEYKATNFMKHGHDLRECDLIICWLDDWENAPVPILSLLDMSHSLGIKYKERENKKNIASTKIEFRVGHDLKARLDTMAKQNYRTPSAMARILLEEALNQRECSDLIRKVDRPEEAGQ